MSQATDILETWANAYGLPREEVINRVVSWAGSVGYDPTTGESNLDAMRRERDRARDDLAFAVDEMAAAEHELHKQGKDALP